MKICCEETEWVAKKIEWICRRTRRHQGRKGGLDFGNRDIAVVARCLDGPRAA